MRRAVVAQLIASSILALSACQSALALDNLFGGNNNMFPEESLDKPLFSEFKLTNQTVSNPLMKKDPAAAKKAFQDMVSRDDDQMRDQMQKVASWLQEFSLRNQNRFPGVYGSSNTIERAAEVQLTELVGPNPYANAAAAVQDRELSGLTPGLSYYYNADGTPNTGGPLANDEWTAELTADNAHRVQLGMDEGITNTSIEGYRQSAPMNWQGAPGTINGRGDGQGNLYVYGIGVNGKPLKDAGGQSTYLIFTQTANNVEDQGQEAGY